MVRGSFLVLLAALAVGCQQYRSRGQGPFADRPRKAAPPAALPPGPAARSPVTAPPTAANPVPPAPPEGPTEASPVPPRPPAGVTPAAAVVPPQPPRPPAVPEESVAVQTPPPAAPPVRTPPPQRATPAPAAAAAPPAANGGAAAIAKLADTATRRWASIDTLEAKLTRREAIGRGAAQTEEVLLQVRREPYAVFMRNTGEVGRGREVLYNPSKHEDKVHAIVGEGDSRLYKAGLKAPSLSPDSPLVRAKSRRSIRDAGPGTAVATFARLVQTSPGDLKYAGTTKRPEFGDLPLELVEQTVRPGAEPDADRGGVRSWYFDAKADSPSFGLPVLMVFAETGSIPPRELEYYCYSQVKAPAGLRDADFDLSRLGQGRR